MYAEIDRFMDYLLSERNASRMTVKSYNDDLVQFAAFLAGLEDEEFQTQKGDSDLAAGEITPELIRAFVESCYDRSLKKSSISRKIACLKSFFTYLYNERIIDRNPAAEVSFPRREKPLPRFLYNGEVERILDFPVESFPDFRDRAILETFYATGARVSELAAAEYVDLDLNARSLRVLGKGARERVVFLTDDAVKRIREYLAERRKLFGSLDGPLFVNARGGRLSARGIFGIVDKRSRAAGLLARGARIRSGTVSRRSSSTTGPTSARYRRCSATGTSPPRRCIHMSRNRALKKSTAAATRIRTRITGNSRAPLRVSAPAHLGSITSTSERSPFFSTSIFLS